MTARWFLVLGLMAVAASAHAADDAQDRARSLNENGKTAFDLGSYDEAIDRFTEAYRTYPDPRILFNLAQAYRKNHAYERALELYRQFLLNQPDNVNRQVVEGLIAELEAVIAKQKATDNHPPQGTASTALAPSPNVVTKIEEPRPWYANVAGWALVGGGVVAAGVGIGFFASAASLEDQLAVASDSEKAGLRSDISTRKSVGTVFSVVGGLAAAGGVAIFILAPRTVTRDIVPIRDLRLSLAPSQVTLSWRF
jgi:tetratricopeptide (TPR) repeat protein